MIGGGINIGLPKVLYVPTSYASGKWYGGVFGAATVRGTANNRNHVVPFAVGGILTAQAIGATVTTAGDVGRSVADAVTNSTAVVTSATAAFVATDVGRKVTGTNIPANTYIQTRDSATQITMTQIATGSGSGGTLNISGCVVRLGLYNDDGTGKPGNLLYDAGTIDGSSNTSQSVTFTVNQALSTGLYWVSLTPLGVTSVAPVLRGSGVNLPLIGGSTATSVIDSQSNGYFFTNASSYALDPSAGSLTQSSGAPTFAVQAA